MGARHRHPDRGCEHASLKDATISHNNNVTLQAQEGTLSLLALKEKKGFYLAAERIDIPSLRRKPAFPQLIRSFGLHHWSLAPLLSAAQRVVCLASALLRLLRGRLGCLGPAYASSRLPSSSPSRCPPDRYWVMSEDPLSRSGPSWSVCVEGVAVWTPPPCKRPGTKSRCSSVSCAVRVEIVFWQKAPLNS